MQSEKDSGATGLRNIMIKVSTSNHLTTDSAGSDILGILRRKVSCSPIIEEKTTSLK